METIKEIDRTHMKAAITLLLTVTTDERVNDVIKSLYDLLELPEIVLTEE